MLGFLTRSTRKKKARPRRDARPRLELLEARDAPATLALGPVIYGDARSVIISGHISDTTTPDGQTVLLSGAATGQAQTDASGDFSATLTADSLGVVSVQAPGSNVAQVTLTDAAPAITQYDASTQGGNWWELKGAVSYTAGRSLVGLSMSFTGQPATFAAGKTCPVNADGTFDLVVQLNGTPSDDGMVSAVCTTAWGTASLRELVEIHQLGTGMAVDVVAILKRSDGRAYSVGA
jgi:hypothetical protein